MNEMIERVVKAIRDNIQAALQDDALVDYEYAARAAIEAMRKPTHEMLQAGFRAGPLDVGGCRDQISDDSEWMECAVLDPYSAMIDAALK